MLFRRVRIVEDDIQEVFTEGTEDVEEQQLDEGPRYPPEDAQLSRMVHYIFKNKKLPAVLPADVANARNVFPKHLVPLETICTECTENTLLSEPQLITSKATILTMTDVIEGISTYCKCCYRCGMIYRYQEWSDGVHNYDDHILLSLHLCIFLRNSLQTHQAIGSAVEALEKTCGKRFPSHQRVLYAYLHFEALTDHSYTFACVTCGYHPVTVVMDLHKKGVFSMPVSNIEVPPQDFDGKVNAEEFWEGVSLEMISRGLVPSNRQNPFVVCPSYHYWAPWIGCHTRSTSMVLNTEYSKVHTARTPDEASDFNITEDRLTDEILKLKMEAVRSLCKQCGIDSKGSRMDLVMRLRQEMQTRGTYDKIFSKVWGASGGWAVVTCPCAIVYAVKFNLRAESPRDFADILLSMTHFPNLTLYDFARGLATHTNLREPESMLASAGQIKVSLPWLTSKKVVPDENGHPLTGSSEHYALYDRFHEANTKDKKDALRKIELIPEVCGWVNSQCAEQLFAGMRKNNHFLNMMTPTSHIFLVRNILHHYNNARNTKTLEEMKKALHVGMEIEFNSRGQTVMEQQQRPLECPQQQQQQQRPLVCPEHQPPLECPEQQQRPLVCPEHQPPLECPEQQQRPLVCPEHQRPLECPEQQQRPLVCPEHQRPLECPEHQQRPLECPQQQQRRRTLVCPQQQQQRRPLECPEQQQRPLVCPEHQRTLECPQHQQGPLVCPQKQYRPLVCP
ncbi:uncharacterized protein LOC125801123 [Astyanax mexicanus]|uniref:uncharacterized protein LOC125801123 n=1 Tax=Astyanax mexicanus TaxID=7994 RepID=UPI0020CB3271|nr:uncharacterized protein LOC125801123 [Astyanax mexicanus]